MSIRINAYRQCKIVWFYTFFVFLAVEIFENNNINVEGLASINSVTKVQIYPLLSTCIDACQRGCDEIRKVQASRSSKEESASSSSNMKVELKDPNDPRSALTEADCAAHRSIVGSLRREWGINLRIVGEEDDEEIDQKMDLNDFEPLKRDTFKDDYDDCDIDEDDGTGIDISDITIFVDPLDGTREFVEGRLSNCQVLIGIAINGEAVAGAIGIPFPNENDLVIKPTIVYGLADAGSGVIGTPLARGPFPLEKHVDGLNYPRPHIATGDSTADVMTESTAAAIKRFGGSNVVYGGAGNKILATALGEVACAIQHRVGGPWDLCAPQAILNAMGGKMTDLFGDEIKIYDHPSNCNEKGWIASPPGGENLFHEKLVAALSVSPEVQKYKDSIQ